MVVGGRVSPLCIFGSTKWLCIPLTPTPKPTQGVKRGKGEAKEAKSEGEFPEGSKSEEAVRKSVLSGQAR